MFPLSCDVVGFMHVASLFESVTLSGCVIMPAPKQNWVISNAPTVDSCQLLHQLPIAFQDSEMTAFSMGALENEVALKSSTGV